MSVIRYIDFKPQSEQEYWVVLKNDEGFYEIRQCYNDDYQLDEIIINNLKVFRTSNEAFQYQLYLEALQKYSFKYPSTFDEDKYYIYYNGKDDKLYVTVELSNALCDRGAYFNSYNNARQFINDVGENLVKKFMFNLIW